MTLEILSKYWALIAASVLGTAIGLFILFRLYQASARGRLNAGARVLQRRKRAAIRAQHTLEKATRRLAQLRQRAESVKPRTLSEAEEAVQDGAALKKIADDQVLRAQKELREVILEEFPPKRQDVLRKKYL